MTVSSGIFPGMEIRPVTRLLVSFIVEPHLIISQTNNYMLHVP